MCILLGIGYRFFLVVIREQVRTRARLGTEVQIAKDIQESLDLRKDDSHE